MDLNVNEETQTANIPFFSCKLCARAEKTESIWRLECRAVPRQQWIKGFSAANVFIWKANAACQTDCPNNKSSWWQILWLLISVYPTLICTIYKEMFLFNLLPMFGHCCVPVYPPKTDSGFQKGHRTKKCWIGPFSLVSLSDVEKQNIGRQFSINNQRFGCFPSNVTKRPVTTFLFL